MQPWHPGQSSVVSTGRLAPCNTPRNPYQETVKHTKPHSWETCRQIINLLGTIKAFRYFWLQIPVTHTRIQTSFFSPFEGFFPPARFTSASLLHKANCHCSPRERWGQSRWWRKGTRPRSSHVTPQYKRTGFKDQTANAGQFHC